MAKSAGGVSHELGNAETVFLIIPQTIESTIQDTAGFCRQQVREIFLDHLSHVAGPCVAGFTLVMLV